VRRGDVACFYNDNEPSSVRWLQGLMDAGMIGDGVVSGRSIHELGARDLDGFDRVHLFAGIGGWEHALGLAGWPAGRDVWTGSPPCQPFSAAGRMRGEGDERHLWPEMLRLVRERRPPTVFGEQVASELGREWLARVRADLEALGYAVGAADLCAAGVSAPHLRQRLFWVADAGSHVGRPRRGRRPAREDTAIWGAPADDDQRDGEARGLADAEDEDRRAGVREAEAGARPDGERRRGPRVGGADGWRRVRRAWDDFVAVPFGDGRWRRVESGTQPLADGVPERMAALSGFGNAIVPQVAAVFIVSYLEAVGLRAG
jgi:DNA (cytosine-5)-methyltransferase 1